MASQGQTCRAWKYGKCRREDKCTFLHPQLCQADTEQKLLYYGDSAHKLFTFSNGSSSGSQESNLESSLSSSGQKVSRADVVDNVEEHGDHFGGSRGSAAAIAADARPTPGHTLLENSGSIEPWRHKVFESSESGISSSSSARPSSTSMTSKELPTFSNRIVDMHEFFPDDTQPHPDADEDNAEEFVKRSRSAIRRKQRELAEKRVAFLSDKRVLKVTQALSRWIPGSLEPKCLTVDPWATTTSPKGTPAPWPSPRRNPMSLANGGTNTKLSL